VAAAATVALLAACAGGARGHPTSTFGSSNLVSIGAGLQGKPDLRATVFARGLTHVAAFAVDDRGRLWAATSGQDEHGADAVSVVPVAGAAPRTVISGLRGPIGLAWSQGTLYVASIGRVDAYAGLTGTRFAAHRLVLRGPVAGAMNGGLTLLPDGRLLMSVASPCDHCTPASPRSATIVTFNPDGSNLRVYATGVRDAFGIAYDAESDQVIASLNQRDDLGSKTPRDWLAIVKQDDDWGFPSCYGQGGAACAGVPSPAAVLDTHAGAGGVAVLSGGLAGPRTGTLPVVVAEWAKGVVLLARVPSASSAASPAAGSGSVSIWAAGFTAPLAVLSWPGHGVLVGDWSSGTVYLLTPTSAGP
jgi:glucose/arabinose dehydrogenase